MSESAPESQPATPDTSAPAPGSSAVDPKRSRYTRTAAIALGALLFAGAGYAAGNQAAAPAGSVPTFNGTLAPGGANAAKDALGKSSAEGYGYTSNVLTPGDNADSWPQTSSGSVLAGYAAQADEATRQAFTRRLLSALDVPAQAQADGSVQWNDCSSNICRFVGVNADPEGTFSVSLGNWPSSCATDVPPMVKEGAPQPLTAPSATASAAAGTSTGASAGPTGGSAPGSPAPSYSCTPPAAAPSVAAVQAKAREWIKILGFAFSNTLIQVVQDESSFVTTATIVNAQIGVTIRQIATLTYAGDLQGDPQLVSANGSYAPLVAVADYKVIGALEAVQRTHDAQFANVAAVPVWDTSGVRVLAVDGAVSAPNANTDTSVDPQHLQGKLGDVIVDFDSYSFAPVTDVHGRSIWVPAYRMVPRERPAAGGIIGWDVIAVDSKYFSQ